MTKFITDSIRQHIIYDVNRDSDQERIDHLILNRLWYEE